MWRRGPSWCACWRVCPPVRKVSPSAARGGLWVTEYAVIADTDGFSAAVRALGDGTGPVAVDVERASGFRYSQRAYLIQVFRRDAGIFLFDPSEKIGRASCRERVCQYVSISVVAESLKKKNKGKSCVITFNKD